MGCLDDALEKHGLDYFSMRRSGLQDSRREGKYGGSDSAGGFRAAKEFVNAPPVLFGAVEDEDEFGGAANLQAFAELVADEASGGGQGFDGGLLLRFAAYDADVDSGLLHVRRHAHFGDGGESRGETRVFQFAGKHDADFLADFSGDAFVTMSCDGHSLEHF